MQTFPDEILKGGPPTMLERPSEEELCSPDTPRGSMEARACPASKPSL